MKKSDFLSKIREEKKLELVDHSSEISRSYSIKADNCLKSAKILMAEKLYENSIGEAYYAMYNSALSLLFRCGIKCENHSAAIVLLDKLFNLQELKEILSNAKQDRIDTQYYVPQESGIEVAERMLRNAEKFILGIRVFIGKLSDSEIGNIRKKFNELC